MVITVLVTSQACLAVGGIAAELTAELGHLSVLLDVVI